MIYSGNYLGIDRSLRELSVFSFGEDPDYRQKLIKYQDDLRENSEDIWEIEDQIEHEIKKETKKRKNKGLKKEVKEEVKKEEVIKKEEVRKEREEKRKEQRKEYNKKYRDNVRMKKEEEQRGKDRRTIDIKGQLGMIHFTIVIKY